MWTGGGSRRAFLRCRRHGLHACDALTQYGGCQRGDVLQQRVRRLAFANPAAMSRGETDACPFHRHRTLRPPCRAAAGRGAGPEAEPARAGDADDRRISPRQMAAVLRERGNPAEITTDNNRTRLTTEISGLRTSVHFYSCNDGGCQSIQYRTLFRRNERFTLAFVNAWNYEKRFAKAYLDRDGDPRPRMGCRPRWRRLGRLCRGNHRRPSRPC